MCITRKLVLGMLGITLLSGCASSKFVPAEVKTPGYQPSGNYKLYAELQKDKGKWGFTNIRTSPNTSKPTVTLGSYDLFSERSLAGVYGDCTAALWSKSKPCSDNEFVEKVPTASTYAMPILGGVIVPYLWVPFGFPIPFEQAFDYDEYHDVINEAKSNGKYDEVYPDIYKKYVDIARSVNNAPEEYRLKDFEELRQRHKVNLTSYVRKQLKFRISDKSGFVPPYLKSKEAINKYVVVKVDFKELVDSPLPYTNEGDALRELNAASLDELSQNLAKVSMKVNDIRETNKSRLASNKALFNQVDEELSKKQAVARFMVAGDALKARFPEYDFTVPPPQSVSLKGGDLPSGFAIPLVVNSRTFKDVMPEEYAYGNKDLTVSLSGKIIKISNNTDKYITVDALSLYHKKDILTRRGTDIEVPPNAVVTKYMSDFNTAGLDNDYYRLTAHQARRVNFDFGFALKYRMTGETSLKSLYKLNSYNVFDLIKNRA